MRPDVAMAVLVVSRRRQAEVVGLGKSCARKNESGRIAGVLINDGEEEVQLAQLGSHRLAAYDSAGVENLYGP